jgi:SAM-dependent methyltransferase
MINPGEDHTIARMPEYTNLEEYADPALYDQENAEFTPQGPFFLDLARQSAGPVLELGCGTGRITLPLARAGIAMTGLDVVPGMLAQARRKAPDLPVAWIADDARSFHLPTRFRLIFATAGVFQHQLARADQEALLARVHEHLAPGGLFVADVIFPYPKLMRDVEEEEEWFAYIAADGREVRVSGTEHYDHLRQVKLETAYRRWVDASGQEHMRIAPLALRYFFPQELEALLHYNGFTVLQRYGDWDRSPLADGSPNIILVCKKSGDS